MKTTRTLLMAVLVTAAAVGTAKAGIVTEDFEVIGKPGGAGFDPKFSHRIGLDEFGRSSNFFSQFMTDRFTSPLHSLGLGATDYITFNLNPSEYVDYAEVWMLSNQNSPPAYFHVIGTQGELLLQTTGGAPGGADFARFDTFSANLGQIVEIRLTGYEAWFDDLTINLIPEPGAILLLGTGGFLLMRRRARSRVLLRLTPLFLALATPLSVQASLPGGESIDIVFLIDGSQSIVDASFQLEKAGVKNSFSRAIIRVPLLLFGTVTYY